MNDLLAQNKSNKKIPYRTFDGNATGNYAGS